MRTDEQHSTQRALLWFLHYHQRINLLVAALGTAVSSIGLYFLVFRRQDKIHYVSNPMAGEFFYSVNGLIFMAALLAVFIVLYVISAKVGERYFKRKTGQPMRTT